MGGRRPWVPGGRLPQRAGAHQHHHAAGEELRARVRHEHLPDRVGVVLRAPEQERGDSDLGGLLGDPNLYKVSAGQADDIVTLVDNVKDANFFDPSTPDGQTYIAGFFYSVFNDFVNRNVMTIDAFDWLHRTGATPPDDQADPAYAACAAEQGQSRPYGAPRPHLYEGTFAHEYQHLLESYASPG